MTIASIARALRRAGVLLPLLLTITVATADAQGKGKGNAGGKGKAGSGPVTSGSAGPVSAVDLSGLGATADGFAIRQFGAWLDDASLLAPGAGWTSISFGRYNSLGGSQTDFPVVDAGFGISDRTQFGITVPYYHARFMDGTAIGGFGDVFLSGKVLLVEPGDDRPWGMAISPVIEFSQDPAPGNGNVTWGAPVSVELRAARYRVFGSTGYFSRGALFGAGAVEVPIGDRLVTTGGLTLMRSVNESLAADALALAKSRADITASAAYFVSPAIAVFAGTGRTIGNPDGMGTTFMLSGGVSISIAPSGGL